MFGVWLQRLLAMGIGSSLGVVACFVAWRASAEPTGIVDPFVLRNMFRVERLRPRALQHRERVRASCRDGTPAEWSGSYVSSTGYASHQLDLGPAGFFYEYSHCTGTGELAYGTIASVEGARITLEIAEHVIVEREEPREGRRQPFRLTDELYVVPWGDERFLVPAELMPEFCSLAKGERWDAMKYADYPEKIEPGESPFRSSRALEGLPDVPAEFRALLPD